MTGDSQALSRQPGQGVAVVERSAAAELTILTVGIQKHYEYLRRQIEMIDVLNPGADYRFLAVDNAALGKPNLVMDDPRCTVLAGVDAAPLPEQGRGSYHHAAALNMAIRTVRTRYALVLDPDLFVVYRNWIGDCIGHMRKRDLGFFGTPWHSRWYRKWRGFPCVHFLLIDLHKVPVEEIDFTPALVEDLDADASPQSTWLKTHAPLLYSRLLIETRRDTGWMLNHRFRGRFKADLLQPVLNMDKELTRPVHLQTARGRRFERRLPRRWSFLPSPGSYVPAGDAPGFAGAPFKALGPEQFVWRGAPFCFHLRRNVRDNVWGRDDQNVERDDLELLLQQVAYDRPWTDWTF